MLRTSPVVFYQYLSHVEIRILIRQLQITAMLLYLSTALINSSP